MQRCPILQCSLWCSKSCIYKTHKMLNTWPNFPAHCKEFPPFPCSVCALGCTVFLGSPLGPPWHLPERELDLGSQGWHRSPTAAAPPWWVTSMGKVLVTCNTAVWHKQNISTLVSRASKWYSACLLCSPFQVRLVLLFCKCTAADFSQALPWAVRSCHL